MVLATTGEGTEAHFEGAGTRAIVGVATADLRAKLMIEIIHSLATRPLPTRVRLITQRQNVVHSLEASPAPVSYM